MNLETILSDLPISDNFIWVIEVFLVVFFTLLFNFIEIRIYNKFSHKLDKTPTVWDNAFLWAIHKPLGFLIWLMGLSYAIKIASVHAARPELFAWLPTAKSIGIVLIITWALLRFAKRAEHELLKKAIQSANSNEKNNNLRVDQTTAQAIGHLLRISIIITATLVILRVLNIDITAVLALGGAGSLIIGFAAKDMLANFFGAMIIYLDKPFRVGDWISSPDKSIEGVVEYIGWRMTTIRSFDKRPLYVPNSIFANISVQNPSRMTNRRLREVFGVRYKDARHIKAIVIDVKTMLSNHPDVDKEMAMFVSLDEFGPSSLNCVVYAFTKTTEWIPYQEIKQDIMLKIIDIVDNHGAEMAFPTRTLEIPDGIDLNHSPLELNSGPSDKK